MKLYKHKSIIYFIVLFSSLFFAIFNIAHATSGHGHGGGSSHSHSHGCTHGKQDCCITKSGTHHHASCCPPCCTVPNNDCTNLFTDAIQSHSTGSKRIQFLCDARIINNPDNVLESKNSISEKSGCAKTCGSVNCVASGTAAKKLEACKFQFRNGGSSVTVGKNKTKTVGSGGTKNYNHINVKQNGTVNFTNHGDDTVYKIEKLSLGKNATANVTPGNYWIRELNINSNDIKINVVGEGTARIFVAKDVTFGQRALINQSSGEQNPAKKLLLYAYNDVTIKENSVFYGFVYSKKSVLLKEDVGLEGAILGKSVKLEKRATVTYDVYAVGEVDMDFLCPDVTHFELTHLNEGIKCFKHNVTVTVKRGNETVTDYTEKVVLDTGTGMGTWYLVNGDGTFTDATPDDGLAEYTFADSDNGVAEFQLLYAGGVGVVEVDVEVYQKSNPDIRDDDTSGLIKFYLWGYVISALPFDNALDPQAQVYNKTQLSGKPETMFITAYGQGEGQSIESCNVRTEYSGSVTVSMWQNYVNPTSGTMTMSINGTHIGTSEPNAVNITLPFVSGRAEVTSLYKDVGMLKVFVKSEEALHPGSTDNFVVKPYSLRLTVYDNPKASDCNGPVFRKAGDPFRASVEVLEMGGALTPNFGNEIVPERVEVFSSDLVAPTVASGESKNGRNGSNNDGIIGNGSNLSKVMPGKFESNILTFDEVGIIKLKAQIFGQDYLGAGNVQSLASDNVGRFIPYVFDVVANTPIFQTACPAGQFTYVGQPFFWSETPVLTVTAKSRSNTITTNYFGCFWKLVGADLTHSLLSNSVSPITTLAGPPSVVSNNDGSGVVNYDATEGYKFNKINGTHIAPFDAEIQFSTYIIDRDDVVHRGYPTPFTIGAITDGDGIIFTQGKTYYQGRFNIKDNIGLESKTGKLRCMTEYYNGVGYILNKKDSCTVFVDPAYLVLDKEPDDLDTTPTIDPLDGGRCMVKLSPPTGGKRGKRLYIIVTPQLQLGFYGVPWLQHDWRYTDTLDGVFDDNPAAKYVFGYRGGDESIIYTEEPLEDDD